MNSISYKQLSSLQLDPGGFNSLLNPLDMAIYEKNALFMVLKVFSTLLPVIFYDYLDNCRSIAIIINLTEAVVSDFSNGNIGNTILGLILACYTYYYDININSNFIVFLIIYVTWNLLYCYKNSDFKYALVHNFVPVLSCLFTNDMRERWGFVRCICIVVSVLNGYINYLNTKQISQN
jgi:hypothetical protein